MDKHNPNFKIEFDSDNRTPNYIDGSFFSNMPSGIIFDVEFSRDTIILSADGYGKEGNYGVGSIMVKIAHLLGESSYNSFMRLIKIKLVAEFDDFVNKL